MAPLGYRALLGRSDGVAEAEVFGWSAEDLGKEAREWEGSGWPGGGFYIEEQTGVQPGSGASNEFMHAYFSETTQPVSLPPLGPGSQLYRLERRGNGSPKHVGWLLAEGVPLERLLWMTMPATQGNLIEVGEGQQLHFLPVTVPPQLPPALFTIDQSPLQQERVWW